MCGDRQKRLYFTRKLDTCCRTPPPNPDYCAQQPDKILIFRFSSLIHKAHLDYMGKSPTPAHATIQASKCSIVVIFLSANCHFPPVTMICRGNFIFICEAGNHMRNLVLNGVVVVFPSAHRVVLECCYSQELRN